MGMIPDSIATSNSGSAVTRMLLATRAMKPVSARAITCSITTTPVTTQAGVATPSDSKGQEYHFRSWVLPPPLING